MFSIVRLLSLGTFAPLLLLCIYFRWYSTLFFHSQLPDMQQLEFWLSQGSFYLAFWLWLRYMLSGKPRFPTTIWLMTALLVVAFMVADIAFSVLIGMTGDGASLYVSHYVTSIADGWESVYMLRILTLLIVPLLFLTVLSFKYTVTPHPFFGARYLLVSAVLTTGIAVLLPVSDIPRSLANAPLVYYWKTAFIHPAQQALADSSNETSYEHSSDTTAINPADEAQQNLSSMAGYNLVMVVMESTRASALSYYNPQLTRSTAFFDELAGQSLVAQRAYSAMPHTSKALVAINCGHAPYPHTPILESQWGTPTTCLAQKLAKQHYQTVFFQSPIPQFENRPGLAQQFGFKQFFSADDMPKEGFEIANNLAYEDDIMLPFSKQWHQQHSGPFFAFYLTATPHWPYWTPSDYDYHEYTETKSLPVPLRVSVFEQHTAINDYLNSVYYTDHFLRKLINQYKAMGLYENTIFVVVGDHGEGFGEHRHFQHNNNLYQEGVHIPLLIHVPGKPELVGKVEQVVSQTDLLKTLEHLLSKPDSSLASLPIKQLDEHRAVFSACWYYRWCIARTDRQFKYIYNFNDTLDELYDLTTDPDESNNIARSHPERVRQYRQEALEWHERQLLAYHKLYSPHDPGYLNLGNIGGTDTGLFLTRNQNEQTKDSPEVTE